MNDLKINDIKPLIEVPDYSFYIFILIILILFSLFSLLIFYIYKKYSNRGINYKKMYIQNLKNIDLKKGKNAAYEITKYLNLLEKNEKQNIIAIQLIEDLNQYKYKKENYDLNENTILLYKSFLETL